MTQESTTKQNSAKIRQENASITTKIHGITSIIIGGIGSLAILFMLSVIIFVSFAYSLPYEFVLGLPFTVAVIFIFGFIPNVYYVVSGIYLVRNPSLERAKALVIANLVVGVFSNIIITILAIVNLVQIVDYKQQK